MTKPLTDAELAEMQQWVWACEVLQELHEPDSLGPSVKYVHRLLAEVRRLKLTEVQRAEIK